MDSKRIEQAVQRLLQNEGQLKMLDFRLRYDIKNNRKVSLPRKLLALYQAGMIEIHDV